MTWPDVFLVLLAIGWLYWVVTSWCTPALLRGVPCLDQLSPPDPPRWPSLSVILPACNEAEVIEAALVDRLKENYPHVEFIVVEDRSTDATPAIVDRIAAADPRVVVEHVRQLPDGWLGKTNAMRVGAARARGDWLLFSDADVHVQPGVMRTVIAHCELHAIDFLSIMPDLWPNSFLLDTALSTFARSFAMICRLWSVPNPRKKAFAGIGAFNLVRRGAFDAVGGFDSLRLTVVDDMGLGLLQKRAGMRCAVLNGRGAVGLHFYRSLGEMLRGIEKSVLAVNGFSMIRVLAGSLAFAWLECAPFIGLVAHARPWATWTSAVVAVMALVQAIIVGAWMRRPVLSCLCIPLGVTITTIAALRSGLLGVLRGGIMWRGTLYPNKELRKHSQVTLP